MLLADNRCDRWGLACCFREATPLHLRQYFACGTRPLFLPSGGFDGYRKVIAAPGAKIGARCLDPSSEIAEREGHEVECNRTRARSSGAVDSRSRLRVGATRSGKSEQREGISRARSHSSGDRRRLCGAMADAASGLSERATKFPTIDSRTVLGFVRAN